MKRTLYALIPALFLLGCTTTGEPDINRISLAVQEAARIGTQEAIRDHPEWRETFTLVRDQLQALGSRDKLTVTDLLDAIDLLPVSELSSDTARLAISAARLTVVIAGWSDIDIVQTGQIRPVVIALSNGITSGLSMIAANRSRGAEAMSPAPVPKHYKSKK